MGCCNSREPGTNPTSPNTHSTSPSRNAAGTTATTRVPLHSTSFRTSQHDDPSSTTTANSTSARPNKPLRTPSPVARCPPERALYPWTPSQLAREREAFFDTRVTGDPAVWTALRHICDCLRNDDLPAAQAVMDAAGLTCPTGRIKSEKPRGVPAGSRAEERERRKGAVFDESGRGYEIPGWVVGDPLDLAPEPEDREGEKLGADEEDSDEEEFEGGDVVVDGVEGKKRRRDREKGKSRAEDTGNIVRIRARLSDRGSDVLVDIGERQKVKVLVKKILECSGEKSGGKRLRLFILGKELSEEKSLLDQGWTEGHIISAMVLGPIA